MEFYPIKGQLQMKKIEPMNEKDLWLLHHLTIGKDVYGGMNQDDDARGFLWDLEKETFVNLGYLEHEELYGSAFSIYYGEYPIGFLDVSGILYTPNSSYVDFSYALVKEARGHGYMKDTLSIVSDDILRDRVYGLDFCECFISPFNSSSIKVACASGFSRDVSRENEENLILHCYTKKRK